MITSAQFERLDPFTSQPAPVPMDESAVYEIGQIESGIKFFGDRAIAFLEDAPTVSTGTFSIGTNSPNFDNIMPATTWGLLGFPPGRARNRAILADGGSVATGVEGTVKLKVNKGLLDSGGSARVVLLGFNS